MTEWLNWTLYWYVFSSVQSLSRVRLCEPMNLTACQASWSITNSQSSLKLISIKSVMPSSHLILFHPILLLSPIPPNTRVFSNESTLPTRWPKYWSFSFSVSPSNEWSNSHLYMTTWKTVTLSIWTFVRKVVSLVFNTVSRFVLAFLPRSKHLLI